MQKKFSRKVLYFVVPILVVLFAVSHTLSKKSNTSVVSNNLISEAVSLNADTVPVPIIMYHQVKYSGPGKDSVTPEAFESDLQYLEKNGFQTITMEQLIDYVYYDVDLPANPIVLSFDDGYLSNYQYVLPLLKKYNQKIVLSIIGKYTDDFTETPDSNLEYTHVTWDQLNEMLDSGLVEVQNHTYNLHLKANGRTGCMRKSGESFEDYRAALYDDIDPFQDQISLMTGSIPTTFAYPYGRYSDVSDQILKEMGFKATLTCDFGINLITKDPDDLFELKRMCRSSNRGIGQVIDKGVEALKYQKLASERNSTQTLAK